MEPVIEFKDFSFKYRAQTEPTLRDINLSIMPGEKVLIVGPSGSGKSTLAHCINGLAPFSYPGDMTGTLRVDGKDPAKLGLFGISQIVGTVLQDTDGQFIGLTVAEDLAFSLENNLVPQEEMFVKVDEVAELVDVKKLLESALPGYMAPYTAVADVFDMRDFIQAYLDASLKGETERYQLHTGMTKEEATAWYEESFKNFEMDGFSEEQSKRFVNAMKGIFKNCKYSVGITKRNTMTEYVFDLTTTPNTSVLSATEELNAGVYYSQDAVNAACLDIYDKYAAESTYGEEKIVTVTWNAFSLMNDQMEDAEYNKLMDAVIPVE